MKKFIKNLANVLSILKRLFLIICLSINFVCFAQKTDPNLRQMRTELLRLHNEIRAKNGAGRLVLNEKLNIAAQRHAEDMCHNNYFAHISPDGKGPWDRAKASGYITVESQGTRSVSENIASNTTDPKLAVDVWVKSPPHFRGMITKCYRDVGFGYYKGYWVAVFGCIDCNYQEWMESL